MRETSEELRALQDLLDGSRVRSSAHLRGIINDDRVLSAREIVGLLTGMKVLALATATPSGAPRISAVDGHFLHGAWTFSTSGSAVKAAHLQARPEVSAAHIDGETLAVFSHGTAETLTPDRPGLAEVLAHWTDHYGSSPLQWGPDIRMYRLRPGWMVGYAADRAALLREQGPPPPA